MLMGLSYSEVFRVGPNAVVQVCLQEVKNQEHRRTQTTCLHGNTDDQSTGMQIH